MKIPIRRLSLDVSRRSTAWLTLLLVLVVLVPSGCLLWFMNQAVENEQLATRQKLTEAYRGQLAFVQKLLETHWQQTAEALETQALATPAPALFANLVRTGAADAVIVFHTNGNVAHPNPLAAPKTGPVDPAWVVLRGLEGNDLLAAAGSYARLANQAANIDLAARALQAQVRCLVQAGKRDDALEILTGPLADERYRNATDGDGRLIVPNAEIMAYEFLGQSSVDRADAVFARLRQELEDYESPMPAVQRRFLMRQMQRLRGDDTLFPTLAAEDLAASFLESGGDHSRDPVLRTTPLPGVWQFASSRGRVVTLHQTKSLLERMRQALPAISTTNVVVDLILPGQEASESLLSLSAGPSLPGWRLSLALRDQRLHEAASKQKMRVYVWIGLLVVALATGLAVLALGLIRRQAALTQLRNDLVANVTHELKTPLASTRLLVETLLNSEQLEEKTAREYLQLIARENLRLSRLIDNFLTFSRIQRNKYTFDFKEVPAASIAETAVATMRERFNTPGCHFNAHIPAALPRVRADADALVTALLNLLDNAYKYSGESKEIAFKASAGNGSVRFSVQDNGIGLSPRDAERVFNRFFQVDQHLSRTSGGAGLGLSIVQFVVNAHGGTVRVQSEPEQGSIFTLTIPVSDARWAKETKL